MSARKYTLGPVLTSAYRDASRHQWRQVLGGPQFGDSRAGGENGWRLADSKPGRGTVAAEAEAAAEASVMALGGGPVLSILVSDLRASRHLVRSSAFSLTNCE